MKHPTPAVNDAVAKALAARTRFPVTMMELRGDASRLLSSGQADPWDESVRVRMDKAINRMAADGTVVKVGQRQPRPDGRLNRGRQPLLWTPAAWDAAVAAHQEEAARDGRLRDEYGKVWDVLDAAGLTPCTIRGEQVRLTLATWQELTRRLSGPEPD